MSEHPKTPPGDITELLVEQAWKNIRKAEEMTELLLKQMAKPQIRKKPMKHEIRMEALRRTLMDEEPDDEPTVH